MQYSSEDQLSVSYGHLHGSGSGAKNETKAIYKHFANLLIDPVDQAVSHSRYFKFTGVSGSLGIGSAGVAKSVSENNWEDDMYFIVAERARMKDRLNKENWTLNLSGSHGRTVIDGTAITGSGATTGSLGTTLTLTDDSKTVTPTATHLGPRYNIVSGSDGTIIAASSSKFYGHYYPSVGVMALRAQMLSGSLPGAIGNVDSSSFNNTGVHGNGLAPELNNDGTADNAIKLAQAIHLEAQTFRSEEDQTSRAYFCRALANDFNFSNNPTFSSGSNKALRNQDMVGYPHTFITTVGLYQTSAGGSMELVAVGRLSSPVQKNYGTEATVKVKLTY